MVISAETVAAEGFLAGNYAPVRSELAVPGLCVEGELPKALNGTLYRNGPNPQFPAPQSHWFVGDGMLHAMTLRDGAASYRNRWVRTPKWLAENRAGRALYAGFGSRLPNAPEWATDDQGSANTHVIWHGGRLLALEEGHLPTEVDPHTLQTRGYQDYGVLTGPCTAHPKIDPVTGEMLFFGYSADGPFTPRLSFGVLDAAGVVRRYERFDLPYVSMIHDFMITERHALFPVLPLAGSQQRADSGGPPYAWEPQKGALIGVMRRDGSSGNMRWFRGEACYAFHVMNAWEEGETLIAEVMLSDEPPLFPHADGSPGDPAKQRARLTRWTFDLGSRTDRFEQVIVDDLTGEFPRIDERRSGLHHRHGWFACAKPGSQSEALCGVAHLDRSTGRRQTYLLPGGDQISEPVFAPRGPEEGDGWIMAVAWRAAEERSEVLLFEAREVQSGPIATVKMPQRIPFGFHGSWVPQEVMT
jgi:carotenoid cleavage dioxygenase-like enzyme